MYPPSNMAQHNANADMPNAYDMQSSHGYLASMQNMAGMMQNWPQQLPQFPDNPLIMGQQTSQMQMQKQLASNQAMVDTQLQQQMMSPNWPVQPLLPVDVPLNKPNVQPVDLNKLNEPASVGAQPRAPSANAATDNNSNNKNNAADKANQDTDDNDSSDDYEEKAKPTDPPRKKSRKHKKLENKKLNDNNGDDTVQNEMASRIQSDMTIEFLDHDGASERPGGAVLSLTLGKLYTFLRRFHFGMNSFICSFRYYCDSGIGHFSWMPG